MMNNLKHIVILLIFGLVVSCSQTPSFLEVDALSKYVINPDHGLFKAKKANEIDLSLYYKPTGLLVAQEADKNADEETIQQLNQKYEPYAYFILDVSANQQNALYGTGNLEAFSENLQTMAFRMDQYANLTTSTNDTIPVADFIYPRTFGISKSATVMFIFNKEKFTNTDWVSFNLLEFGMKTGDQQFRFKTKDISNVPKLKI